MIKIDMNLNDSYRVQIDEELNTIIFSKPGIWKEFLIPQLIDELFKHKEVEGPPTEDGYYWCWVESEGKIICQLNENYIYNVRVGCLVRRDLIFMHQRIEEPE